MQDFFLHVVLIKSWRQQWIIHQSMCTNQNVLEYLISGSNSTARRKAWMASSLQKVLNYKLWIIFTSWMAPAVKRFYCKSMKSCSLFQEAADRFFVPTFDACKQLWRGIYIVSCVYTLHALPVLSLQYTEAAGWTPVNILLAVKVSKSHYLRELLIRNELKTGFYDIRETFELFFLIMML